MFSVSLFFFLIVSCYSLIFQVCFYCRSVVCLSWCWSVCSIFVVNKRKHFGDESQKHKRANPMTNKKYVLWNMGICPIVSKVGHVTLATPPLGSFIVLYVVLAIAYPTKKKRRVKSTFIHLKVMESEVPKFKKVGHVTLATPTLGVIPHPLSSTRCG